MVLTKMVNGNYYNPVDFLFRIFLKLLAYSVLGDKNGPINYGIKYNKS